MPNYEGKCPRCGGRTLFTYCPTCIPHDNPVFVAADWEKPMQTESSGRWTGPTLDEIFKTTEAMRQKRSPHARTLDDLLRDDAVRRAVMEQMDRELRGTWGGVHARPRGADEAFRKAGAEDRPPTMRGEMRFDVVVGKAPLWVDGKRQPAATIYRKPPTNE